MKREKGFTLIELLSVVVVLGITFMIVLPKLVGLINEGEDKEIELIEERVLSAAKDYVNHIDGSFYTKLYKEGDTNYIYKTDLINSGLLNKEEISKLDTWGGVKGELLEDDKIKYTVEYINASPNEYTNEELYLMIQNITNNGGTGSGGSSGGVSNDAIDDLQEQINNNKAAIENNTSSINTNTTAIGNNLTEINTLKDKNLFLYAYPVGSIFISDTNTNPGTIYGGTWELIGKQFKTTSGSIDTNIFANNTTNVQNVSGSYLLSGNTVSIRLALITNVALTDTSVTLGTFNWNKLGITSPSNNFDRYVAASDDGNAVIATTLAYDTGILQSVDVYGTDSMSAGTYMALHYIFNMRSDRMLDTVCDKFYFKRTA